MVLYEQALRADWPIPPEVKRRILQNAINLADPVDEETLPAGDDAAAVRINLSAKRDRVKIAATRLVIAFNKLSIEQQRLDLMRERLAMLKATQGDDATDAAGGVDPEAAARALKALNNSGESDALLE